MQASRLAGCWQTQARRPLSLAEAGVLVLDLAAEPGEHLHDADDVLFRVGTIRHEHEHAALGRLLTSARQGASSAPG